MDTDQRLKKLRYAEFLMNDVLQALYESSDPNKWDRGATDLRNKIRREADDVADDFVSRIKGER